MQERHNAAPPVGLELYENIKRRRREKSGNGKPPQVQPRDKKKHAGCNEQGNRSTQIRLIDNKSGKQPHDDGNGRERKLNTVDLSFAFFKKVGQKKDQCQLGQFGWLKREMR